MSLRPLSLVVSLASQIKKKKKQKQKQPQPQRHQKLLLCHCRCSCCCCCFCLCFCFVFQYGCDQATSVGKRLLTSQPSCFNISNYAFSTTLLSLSLTLLLSLVVSWGPANLLAATRGNGPHSLSFALFKIVISAVLVSRNIYINTYIHVCICVHMNTCVHLQFNYK